MANKNKKLQGIVYSTDPYFEPENNDLATIFTLSPDKQNLIVRISTQGRAGKKVSLVQRFIGNSYDLENLSKEIKKHCGTGGTIKDGEIIIQGDLCQKILDFLSSKGYRVRKG